MRLFELLNQAQPEQDDQVAPKQGGFDSDQADSDLKDIAGKVNDKAAQPDPPGGSDNVPEEIDDTNMEPIDSALLAQIKNLPYNTEYDHDENSETAPINVAGMNIPDLISLGNKIQYKLNIETMQTQVGADDDTMIEYLSNFMRFINVVLKYKKHVQTASNAKTNPTPSYAHQ